MLPAIYHFLETKPIPPVLIAGLKYFGLKEVDGSGDNPIILQWATEFKISWYKHDSIAWCGLAMAKILKDAGYTPPPYTQLLAAKSFLNFGIMIPVNRIQVGDLGIYIRPGGFHVGAMVGYDKDCHHVYGGNTNNSMSFARLLQHRLVGVRRPPGVEEIYGFPLIDSSGKISTNEK